MATRSGLRSAIAASRSLATTVVIGLMIGLMIGLVIAVTADSALAQNGVSLRNEVTTPLYSSARPAAVVIEKRAPVDSQSSNGHPSVATARNSTIDSATRWQFVSRESISIESSVIRLSDVLRPLEPDMVSWSRLGQSTIGLMPADGGDAKISRDRLAEMIAGANATPGRIKIYGPETIVVQRYHPEPAPRQRATTNWSPPRTDGSIATAAYEDTARRGTTGDNGRSTQPESINRTFMDEGSVDAKNVDPETVDRLENWVRIGVRNQFRELHDAFDYDVHFDGNHFGTLEKIQGIRQFLFLDPPPVWSHQMRDSATCRVRLLGRAGVEDCEGVVELTFHPRPAVVTARRSLRRGHRVTTSDLQYEPYSVEGVTMPADLVESPLDLIGLEVIGLVRSGVALTGSDFAAPRVIRRGELVEVQVGGGGVRVTTGAKALADGALGELIEIETLQPKRRLLAKVISGTLVEIITQAPRVATQTSQTFGRTQ